MTKKIKVIIVNPEMIEKTRDRLTLELLKLTEQQKLKIELKEA